MFKYHVKTIFRKSGSQTIFSVKNTGCFTTTRFRIFIHKFNSNIFYRNLQDTALRRLCAPNWELEKCWKYIVIRPKWHRMYCRLHTELWSAYISVVRTRMLHLSWYHHILLKESKSAEIIAKLSTLLLKLWRKSGSASSDASYICDWKRVL